MHSVFTLDVAQQGSLVLDVLQGQDVSVVKLNKSGGVVKREREERKQARDRRIREYFFGNNASPLQPATTNTRADQLMVYRIGGKQAAVLLHAGAV